MELKRIKVLCAMRDARVVGALRRRMDDRCLFRTVNSGNEALEFAARTLPDILVVDAVLPGLDGVGLIECLRSVLGERMPEVIGGSVHSFSDEAFRAVGVEHLADVPWDETQLQGMLMDIVRRMDTQIDWVHAKSSFERAQQILAEMGMNGKLSGFAYLAWAGALTSLHEDCLYAVRDRLYVPIAQRYHTTPQNVERLIRHAVERTADTVGAERIYTFFGNTIDPMRGKPTNAQMIGMLGEWIRIS